MSKSKQLSPPSAQCHCGAGLSYEACCGVFIKDLAKPLTAEILMRSRYSAFVEGHERYLLATWHPRTRPSRVRLDPAQRWLGLRIKRAEVSLADASWAEVEFLARFKINGKGHRLHEISRFERIDGCWFYLDGEHL